VSVVPPEAGLALCVESEVGFGWIGLGFVSLSYAKNMALVTGAESPLGEYGDRRRNA